MEPGAWLSTLSPRDVRLVTNSRCPLEPTTQGRSLADLPLIFFKERPQIERRHAAAVQDIEGHQSWTHSD